jgi:hypothetical protein
MATSPSCRSAAPKLICLPLDTRSSMSKIPYMSNENVQQSSRLSALFRRKPRRPSLVSLLTEATIAYAPFPPETRRTLTQMFLKGWGYSPEEIEGITGIPND